MNALQQKTADKLLELHPSNRIFWHEDTTRPKFIMGRLSEPSDRSPEEIALTFLEKHADLYALPETFDEQTFVVSRESDPHGVHHVCLAQSVAGVPVYEGSVQVHVDSDGVVIACKDNRLSQLPAATEPVLSADEAVAGAREEIQGRITSLREPKLIIVRTRDQVPRLCWEIQLLLEGELGARILYVDAVDGAILLQISEHRDIMRRTTYTANNGSSLPGALVLEDDQVCDDQVAQAAHDNAANVYRYFETIFGRKSYDDRDAPIVSTVHFGQRYNNAYWSSWYNQMVYGDGDGRVFGPLARALDVVGHEYTHAISSRTARFVYAEEAGALDESFADFFGVMISNDGEITNWLIGEGVYTPYRSDDALRDLSDPPRCRQPDHVEDMLLLKEGERPDPDKNDNGWVHVNSGIPNKAAWLTVAGGTHHGIDVTGIGREKAEQIYYLAMTQYLKSATRSRWTFRQARYALLNACRQLYTDQGSEYAAIKNAWAAVGIGEPASDFAMIRRERRPALDIPDNDPAGVIDTLTVEEEGTIRDIRCQVDIQHTYIGDLRLILRSPGQESVVLHDREGGGADDLVREYSLADYVPLATLKGDQAHGTWELQVSDHAGLDTGVLRKWSLGLSLIKQTEKRLQKTSQPQLLIPDNNPGGIRDTIEITEQGTIVKLKISLDIEHTYIGDLRCTLTAPDGTDVVLHDRSGNGRDNIKKTYDGVQVPGLLTLEGTPMQGQWQLAVSDHAAEDEGALRQWGLDITWR
ncbi:hypothetical protein GF1_12600 [Desulfolithobacter dissulfuricans]|uniref:P/Homo B domain-containing protein n=1 Tax=Desulfolithobacter dissulfuricans TaxID=2795293 RepID=A0A915XHN9_9BACT|nr:M4 family metallopeptidase [Desulfolithobacter dissulfuricans]BCO08884.1 hypothetical protein GF1_12600 [Desulfolithobacter dissulfuricans]